MLLLLLVILLLLYIYCKKKLNYWNRLGVPNTNPLTPLGDLITCFRETKGLNLLYKQMSLEFKKRGEKFFGFYLSLCPVFVPFDIELVKTIMARDHEYFADRGVYVDKNEVPIADNMFSVRSERWKSLRELATKCFTLGKIKSMSGVVANYSKVFRQVIDEHNGQSANIFNLGKRYALDIACGCFFGTDENHLRKGTSLLLKITDSLNCIDTSNMLRVCISDGLGNPSYIFKALMLNKDLNEYMLNYSKQLYDMRKQQKLPRNDFLDAIIAKLDSGDENFDLRSFAGQIFFLIFATYETNSYGLTYTLYQLAKVKDVQDKVRAEILNTMKKNNGNLPADLTTELDYLERVYLESLRIHNVVAVINRYCTKNYKIPGTNVVIEKDTSVIIPPIAVHYDPELFPNPDKFDPDRFLDPKVKQYLLVFGAGQHACLGVMLSKMLVKAAVAELLLKYEVSVNEKTGDLEPVVFRKHVTSAYKNTIWLDFKKLDSRR